MIFWLKVLARLPLPLLHVLGLGLGWLIYFSPGRHRARLRKHIFESGLCQPDAGCKRLLRRAIAENGKAVIELLPVWLRPFEASLKLVRETRGWDALDAARAEGRGVIVVCPHLGCFEIVNLYCAARHPFTAMYKPQKHALLDRLMRLGRFRGQAQMVPTELSGVRKLFAALKRGEAIGLLPDQVATGGDGVWAPFFGRPAYTPTLVASLAARTGAIAFLVLAERLPRGRGFRLHAERIDPALPDDKTAAAIRINHLIEDAVRRFPTQYLWSYQRYKRPGGSPPPR